MARTHIDIQISSPYSTKVRKAWLRRVAQEAMETCWEEQVSPEKACQVGLVITDDDTVRRLNARYRGLDQVTDVLSFSNISQGQWEGDRKPTSQGNSSHPFLLPPQEPQPLGEIIISYPQAERQATASGRQVEEELTLLIVHGVLHLLGHDHAEPAEARAMRTKEHQIFARLTP